MDNEEPALLAAGDELFSLPVRAGKRTYFFDVKQTKRGEPFLVITESRKTGDQSDGQAQFAKSRIHLYRQDFDKFIAGLTEAVKLINSATNDEATINTVSL